MNIISVEHLPPLSLISNNNPTTYGSCRNHTLHQARIVPPPLTIISKGKAVKGTGIVPPQLTIVSKGKVVKGPGIGSNAVPLTIASKGKVAAGNGAERHPLREGKTPLPLVRKGKAIHANVNKTKTRNPKLQLSSLATVPNANVPLTLVVSKCLLTWLDTNVFNLKSYKKYDAVSAPAPFFGRFKSRIPLKTPKHQDSSIEALGTKGATTTNEWTAHQSVIDSDLATNEWTAHESVIDCDLATNERIAHESVIDSDLATNNVEFIGANHTVIDSLSDFVVETSEKAVQTDCCCDCNSRSSSTDIMPARFFWRIKEILENIGKISAELRDLKLNITGKAVVKKMTELFPIKSEADLVKIDYNIENTENFELRLKLYLKYLKPKSSRVISTAFKELIHDDFLVGKNWDGTSKAKPLNVYTFFRTILFDAWKNTMFTKDIYVSAMKEEIKKSHDRERKRTKQATEEESSLIPNGLNFI